MKNKKINKISFFLGVTLLVFCFSFFLQERTFFVVFAAEEEEESTDEEKEKLEKEQEKEQEELDEKIDDYKDELEDVEKEKAQVVQKKLIISSEISKINGNISVIEEKISDSERDLQRVRDEIKSKEASIKQKKELLAKILWRVNQADLEARLTILGSGGDFGEYFESVDTLEQLEQQLLDSVEQVRKEKAEFEQKSREQQQIVEVQSDQKKTLEYEKTKQRVVLNQTQRQINEKDITIGELQSKINSVQMELSALLGEGYSAKDIKDAVKFASKKTGVRKDFLFGMLVIESDLGRYTGGCDYKESRMNSHRKDLFKKICKDLDYNYKKMKVSCPPANYVGTGGAMGVAQFMSDTWMGYQATIASRTGNSPPDPWDLTDGVMAMASKLGNDGATKKSGECRAAMRYLGGSHQWYCDKVLYWADHYEKLID